MPKPPFVLACVAALAVFSAGCTNLETNDPGATTTTPEPTTAALPQLPVGDPSLSGIPGRLLVLGVDNEIATMRPDGSERVTLAPSDPNVEERSQPTWSPAGDGVAWTERLLDGRSYLVVADTEKILSTSPAPQIATHIAWSPDGRSIAMTGDDLEGSLFLAVAGPDGDVKVIDEGAPLYFDWSPDGQSLLVHVADRFEYVGLDGTDRVPLSADGEFRVGSHAGDSIIFGLSEDVGETLVVGSPDGSITSELLRYTAPMAYLVGADERRIAMMVKGSPASQQLSAVTDSDLPILEPNRLVVVDTATGEIELVAEARGVAWWWSPDGEQLLYCTVELVEDVERLQWHAWDGVRSSAFTPFSPTAAFGRAYLAFFDQIAGSADLWAPDGSAFVYAGGTTAEDAGVWVQPLTGDGPFLVSRGQVAVWSPNAG